MVPLVDLTRRHRRFASAYSSATARVLGSGTVLLGPELRALEAELVPVLHGGRPDGYEVVGVGSGASALELTMAALGIGAGDEVIVPAMTAVPTASAVCATGAVPVPVDVDAATAALSIDAAADAVTSRTRAVIVVHLYGRPAAVEPLLAFGVPVIEDAAQAHGALRGVTGTAACYSFYPTKNLGGIGDGGAVITADHELADAIRRRRNHGMSEHYLHVDVSQNHRMSELEAAWLRLLAPHLADDNRRRHAVAARYRAAAPGLRWHADHPDHVVHQCVVRSADRDAFRAELDARGIATGVHYPRSIPQQPAYASFAVGPCPQAAAWAAECVSLPCFPELTDDEVDDVATTLQALE